MDNYNNFCRNILNIRNIDMKEKIKKIVQEEREHLINKNNDLSGYCKYIASIIEERLKENNIRNYWIDLNELINIDHVILIAEYKYNDQIKRFLIDPTYSQFTRKPNAKLLKFNTWPSDNLDKSILKDLLLTGMTELNNHKFNNYLSAFGQNISLSLDEFLLNNQITNLSKRK